MLTQYVIPTETILVVESVNGFSIYPNLSGEERLRRQLLCIKKLFGKSLKTLDNEFCAELTSAFIHLKLPVQREGV